MKKRKKVSFVRNESAARDSPVFARIRECSEFRAANFSVDLTEIFGRRNEEIRAICSVNEKIGLPRSQARTFWIDLVYFSGCVPLCVCGRGGGDRLKIHVEFSPARDKSCCDR